MYKKSKELRTEAWNMLAAGNYWNLFLASFLNAILISAVASVTFFVGGIGVIFVSGTLLVGLNTINLKAFRREQFDIVELFQPFKSNYTQTLVAYILKSIFTILWTLLFVIPGLIKIFSYSMTEYILAENPKIEGNDAITKSRELMDGHKGRLFLLQLSFIGWILLSILTLGIGMIFLIPYMNAATAAFYLDLTKDQVREVELEEEDYNFNYE